MSSHKEEDMLNVFHIEDCITYVTVILNAKIMICKEGFNLITKGNGSMNKNHPVRFSSIFKKIQVPQLH
jgi:hypothetical protein